MLAYFVCLIVSTEALFFQLGAKKQECFGVTTTMSNSKIVGSYEVSGAVEGTRATLFEPNTGKSAWTSAEPSAAISVVAAMPGTYNLCFDSTVSRPQVLSFDIRVTTDYDFDSDAANVATKAHTDKVEALVDKLLNRVLDLEEQQHHGITREEVHRLTAETTSARVAWWSMAKIFALIVCAVGQVWYLKSFFETKRII